MGRNTRRDPMTTGSEQAKLDSTKSALHPDCIVCSSANIKGLKIDFKAVEEGKVESKFVCEEKFEGYPGMMHGGIIASILDGAMGNCMFAFGKATVTVEMTTRYRLPVVIGTEATVSARLIRNSHPLYILEAQIEQDSKIRATAKGKFYYQPQLEKHMKPDF
ncbi:MAG: PaaI family thioesterase [Sedimentisphaeraceae bacterium JB056]